jgi:hypothetical protein
MRTGGGVQPSAGPSGAIIPSTVHDSCPSPAVVQKAADTWPTSGKATRFGAARHGAGRRSSGG